MGIFIFLIIQSLGNRPLTVKQQNLNWVFVSITVIPFAVSAIAILMEDAYPDIHAVKFMQEQVNLPKAAAIAGFVYILLTFIGIIAVIKSWERKNT